MNKAWPLARHDGIAMGVGTEMDRMFKLIADGFEDLLMTAPYDRSGLIALIREEFQLD